MTSLAIMLRKLVLAHASVPTSSGSRCHNADAEWSIGSLRRGCLDHIVILSERHLLTVVGEYVDYYNTTRPHRSMDGDSPEHREEDARDGPVVGEPVLGGLHHRYRRVA